MYTLNENGERIYTLKVSSTYKISMVSVPTVILFAFVYRNAPMMAVPQYQLILLISRPKINIPVSV